MTKLIKVAATSKAAAVSGEVELRIESRKDFGLQLGSAIGSLRALSRRIMEFVPDFGTKAEDKDAWEEVKGGLSVSYDNRVGERVMRCLDSGLWVPIAPSDAVKYPETRVRRLSAAYVMSLKTSDMTAMDKGDPNWGKAVANHRQDVATYIRGVRRNISVNLEKDSQEEAAQREAIAAGERGEAAPKAAKRTKAKTIAEYMAAIVKDLPGKNDRAVKAGDPTALDPADLDKFVAYAKRLIK
jgi:hypothetical protein